MSLELRPNSKSFYCRIQIDGKRTLHTLQTKVEGNPPKGLSLKKKGDSAFEASKIRALEEEKRLKEKLKRPVSKAKTLKKILKIQTGEELNVLKLSELWDLNEKQLREKPLSKGYKQGCLRELQKFTDYLEKHYPKVAEAHMVTNEMAEAYLKYEFDQGSGAGKTINNHKGQLKAIFETALKYDRIFKNPFAKIKDFADSPIHRRPYKVEELQQILISAKNDDLIYPLVVTAMSTAMRLGDCCCLQWSSIDESIMQIKVPAIRKTMKSVNIPYFAPLAEVFAQAKKNSNNSAYVFPEASKLFRAGRQEVIHSRFESILLNAGFTDDENPETSIRLTRETGKGVRRVSIRGFHSFKTTWVTIALLQGLPVEVIKMVTGNQSVEIVMKHYFQPDIANTRKLIAQKMPGLLIGNPENTNNDSRLGIRANLEEIDEIIQSMNENNFRELHESLISAINSAIIDYNLG